MQDIELTLAAMRKLGTWRFNFVFQCYVCPGDKCASHTNEDCWKHNFNGDSDFHTLARSWSTQQVTISSWLTKTFAKEELNHCRGGNETLATETLATHATSKPSFNPRTALPFVETDDRKRFPGLYVVWNNKPGPSFFIEFNWCKDKR